MGKAAGSCFNIMACAGNQPGDGDMEATKESFDLQVRDGICGASTQSGTTRIGLRRVYQFEKGSSEKRRWSFRKKGARAESNILVSETESLSACDNDSKEASDNNFHQPPYSSDPEKATETKPEEDSTNFMLNMSSISEPSVIVIQTAVRGFLAKKQAKKVNADVVKLQAAVRGHLVRRQAVATLRCVLAVVKMQALVRSRLSQKETEKMSNHDSFDATKVEGSKFLKKEISNAKLRSSPSMERLLRNGFACLLLDVTPEAKPIYISCDPEKSESSWKWLERWMAATSPQDRQQKLNLINEPDELEGESSKPLKPQPEFKEKKIIGASSGVQSRILSQVKSFSSVTNDTQKQATIPDHSSVQLKPHSFSGISPKMDATGLGVQSDADKEKKIAKVADEAPDSETRNSIFGSKKSINPAFAAAMTKFEELSTGPSTSRSLSFNRKSMSVEQSNSLQSRIDSFKIPDTKAALNKTPGSINDLRSPDTSQPKGDLGKTAGDDSSASKGLQKQKQEKTNAKPSEATRKVEQLPPSGKTPAMHIQPGNTVQKITGASHQALASATATETHGRTSTHLSTDTSRSKPDNNLAPKKQKPKLTKKKSFPTTSARSSNEHLFQDPTNGKRRSSLDAVNSDQESRVGKSNSLPSFMQATESAKAKFHASDSMKSSTEIHGNDNKQTKKTSMLVENKKQDSSPCLQRSKSKLQQSSKGDGMNPRQNSSEKI